MQLFWLSLRQLLQSAVCVYKKVLSLTLCGSLVLCSLFSMQNIAAPLRGHLQNVWEIGRISPCGCCCALCVIMLVLPGHFWAAGTAEPYNLQTAWGLLSLAPHVRQLRLGLHEAPRQAALSPPFPLTQSLTVPPLLLTPLFLLSSQSKAWPIDWGVQARSRSLHLALSSHL